MQGNEKGEKKETGKPKETEKPVNLNWKPPISLRASAKGHQTNRTVCGVSSDSPIDIVITWVNGSDPIHQKQLQEEFKKAFPTHTENGT